MNDPPGFSDLVNSLRAALAAEYQRGQSDAAQRIINAAQAQVSSSSLPRLGIFESSPKAVSANSKRRAPRGAPDALIKRVLTRFAAEGAPSTEIQALSESDAEKMVSLSGIRFALDRGKSAGRYRNANGKWFLVEDEKN